MHQLLKLRVFILAAMDINECLISEKRDTPIFTCLN